MISWSSKKKIKIIFWLILFGLIIITIIYFIFLKPTPTCFDGIKNGQENGVDCGGNCLEICAFQATEIKTLWTDAFLIKDGVYNIVSLIENPNFNYKLTTDYTIEVYDKKGMMIYQRSDEITLLAAEKRALFLPTIILKKEDVSRVFIIFKPIKSLLRDEPKKNTIKNISKELSENFGQMKLTINLKNNSFYPLKNIEVVALLYDKNGQAIQVGKTFISDLDKKEIKEVFITWPDDISDQVSVISIFTKELTKRN